MKVNGDGTTTINIYYTRNLYTLEFVLARQNNNNSNFKLGHKDRVVLVLVNGRAVQQTSINLFLRILLTGDRHRGFRQGNLRGLTVQKTYRLTEAMNRDSVPLWDDTVPGPSAGTLATSTP